MEILNYKHRPIGGIKMILTVPHVKFNEKMHTSSENALTIVKGEVLSFKVLVDNAYEDSLFYQHVINPHNWYVKVKMVLDYDKEHREEVETACVYITINYEAAVYVGQRLLEKFYRAQEERGKIDLAGMVKGILIEGNILGITPKSAEERGESKEDTDDTGDGEAVPENTVEKWARDDLPTDGNSTGNCKDLLKKYELNFPEGQFTRC